MKYQKQFISRKVDMRKKVSALLTYAFTHPNYYDEIVNFLIINDFLVEPSIIEIKEKKYIINWMMKDDAEALFQIIGIELINTLNPFWEPAPFKDRLQREKNEKLICFCKKVFEEKPIYKKLANMA